MDVRDWLSHTTASKIMVRDVTTLDPTESMARAAGMLLREQISGAPVVDGRGVCLGVLSASDVVGAEEKVAIARQEEAQSSLWHSQLALPASVYEARLAEIRDKIAPSANQPVERFMTPDVVSVTRNTPIHRVIQCMLDAHIHRVLVLDEQRRLQGIITTIDLLAALLRAPA